MEGMAKSSQSLPLKGEEISYRDGCREVTLCLDEKGDVISAEIIWTEPQPLAMFMRPEALLVSARGQKSSPTGKVVGEYPPDPTVRRFKPCGGK